jgi:hypothetical protein
MVGFDSVVCFIFLAADWGRSDTTFSKGVFVLF